MEVRAEEVEFVFIMADKDGDGNLQIDDQTARPRETARIKTTQQTFERGMWKMHVGPSTAFWQTSPK